jgi:RHS repeat-associated protein
MQQGWHSRVRTTSGSGARQRRLWGRRFRVSGALGLSILLAACTADGGTQAALSNPVPVVAKDGHRAKPAPQQRWGEAGEASDVVPGRRNTFVPKSERSRYPVIKAPTPPVNAAEVISEAAVGAPKGFNAATSKELVGERDANERTYANADGTQTTEFSPQSLNYRTADGSWAPIDSTLAAADGGWRRAADAVDLRIAYRADATELVRVTAPGGGVLAYSAAGARAVAGSAAGDTARFADVWDGVDVELQALPGGVKETLVLGSAKAPRRFVFPLRLTGLTASVVGDRVVLKDAGGVARAEIPAGTMIDAAEKSTGGVTYKLVTRAGAPALEVSLDDEWLADPDREFPVRVDPPVTAIGPTPTDHGADESLVVSGNSSRPGGSELLVGRKNSTNSASYLKFGSMVNGLRYHHILGANLSIVNFDAASCKPRPVSVHPVTGSWSSNTDTSYPGPSVGAAIATESFAQGYLRTGQSASSCPVTGSSFDLGTKGRDLIQGWADGKANNGISLRAPVGDSSSWKTFAGPSTANPPRLYVTHSPYNAQIDVPDPAPKPAVLQNQAGKVKFIVTNTSAMDWKVGDFFLVYRVFDTKTDQRVGQYKAADLTATVPRGGKTTLEGTIRALPIGEYALEFSMAKANGPVFSDEYAAVPRIGINVENIAPTVGDMYPPNGYQAPTLTPQLWALATDLDAPPKTSLQYKFEYCSIDAAGKPVSCVNTGYQARQSYVIPAGKLSWSKAYLWRAFVKDNADEVITDYLTLLTSVPQPEITSRIANSPTGSQEREFDPNVGNYSTSAVDASVANVGPALKVVRTYNSLDPRRDLMFGAGWMTQFDMRLVLDNDGSGNAVVTYPDGQQVRFGRNPDLTFSPPPGRTAQLTIANGVYTLLDSAGTKYEFRSDGKILRIMDKWSRNLKFTYDFNSGLLAKVQSLNGVEGRVGRALTFGWTGNRVTSVSTDPIGGTKLTWTYAYTGDLLTKVCTPDTAVCSSYTYAAGSHYRSGVMDSDAEGYWRLGDDKAAAAARSEILNNLGKDSGVVKNVTLAEKGALAGTDNTAALFNGSTSVVELPKGTLKRNRDGAVELWFKVSPSQTGGPLLGYQDKVVADAPTIGVPLLYVGTDGRVRGQFRTSAIAPITASKDVRDNAWHHVVLTVNGTTQTLYLDGDVAGTVTGEPDHSTLTFNQIGVAHATTPASYPAWGTNVKRTFNGTIDEVAVYGGALGPQAVKMHRALAAQADQLASVILPSGKVSSEVTYDTTTDRVKEYTDGNGGTWKIGTPTVYGGDNDLRRSVQVLDPADRPYLYEYDAIAGRMLRSGTPLGLTIREEDRPRPTAPAPTPSPTPTQVCSSPDPGEPRFCTTIPGTSTGPIFSEHELTGLVVRSFSYNAKGQQDKIVNENGDTLTKTFDDRGNVTSQTTCRKVGECYTSYTKYTTPNALNPFDPRNDLPIEVRDARSTSATDNRYLTTTGYNSLGEVTSEKGADNHTTTTTFTNGGCCAPDVSEPGPAGLVGTVSVSLINVDGDPSRVAVTKHTYNVYGDLITVVDPSGLRNEYTYDELGRRTQDKQISDSFPDGVVTKYTYDVFNRVVTTEQPVTTDAVNNVKHQAVSTLTYDVDGNVIRSEDKDKLTDEPARVTTTEYDEYNRVTRTTNPEGDEQTQGYDRFGNRTSVVDGNGNHYEYAFTARNMLAEVRLYDWKGDPSEAPKTGTTADNYTVLNSYAYDYAGRMARQTDSMGRRTEYTYFADDLLDKVVLKDFHDPDGKTRDYVLEANVYDGAGNVTRKTTQNNTLVVTNTFDVMGRVATKVIDPGGLNRTTRYAYDSLGNVIRTEMWGSSYNLPWAVAGGQIRTIENLYDKSGRLSQETQWNLAKTEKRVTSYSYDQRGLLLSQTDPRGNVAGADKAAYTATFRYDENGDQVQSIAPKVEAESSGDPAQTVQPTVTTGYDAFGQVVAVKDALGNIARTTYDRIGRPVSKSAPLYTPAGSGPTVPAAPTTKTVYDALNNPIEATDARGNVTKLTYDRLNRVTVKDTPGSTNDERAVSRFTYTRTGKLLSATSPTGITSLATYDDLDRQVTSTKVERRPQNDTFTTTMKYDDAHNLRETVSPSGARTTMTYTALSELLSTTDPSGLITQQGYDGFGAIVRTTDEAGLTTRKNLDEFGQLESEEDLNASGNPLRDEKYTYDEVGNVLGHTNGLGKTVRFSYDALNRLTKQVEPKSGTDTITTTFGYDAASNRTRYTDGRKNSTFFGVNSLGLPETVVEPSTKAHPAASDRTWMVAYDLNGNAERLTAPGGVQRNRTYDAANRMTVETGSGAATTPNRGLAYNLEGQVTGVTAAAGSNTYAYNDRGGLLTATGPSGTASYAYDADGLLVGRNDAAGNAAFSYKKGRLDTLKDGATGVVQSLGYDTTSGQLKKIDYGSGRVRSYDYDPLGRVASDVLKNSANAEIAKVTYKYDNDDHLVGKDTAGVAGAGSNTYDYDDAGRLTSWTSATGKVDYGWDDSGNRTRAGLKTATYDERNRLLTDGDYTYAYTPRGTLASKTSSGLAEEFSFDAFDRLVSAAGQSYAYDGLNRVTNRNGTAFTYAGFEQDSVSDGTELFGRGPAGELLSVAEGNDKRLTLSDEHGDLVGAFAPNDPLTALSGSTTYDPYGQKIAKSGAQSNVGFQGDWTDPDTDQVNMGARWYDPSAGNFTSRDSVNYSKGDSILANRYTYGAGDPMANNDPTGHWPSCGWCKRAVSYASNVVSTAWKATTNFVSYAYHASGAAWLVNQAKAAVSSVIRFGVNTFKSAVNYVKSTSLYKAAARGIDYVKQKAEQAHQAAVRVTQQAKAAIVTAVKNNPIARVVKATLPAIAGLGKLAVAAFHGPAAFTSSLNNVVQDFGKAGQQLLKEASAAGNSLIDGAKAVGNFISEHKAGIAGFVAGAVVGVGCGVAIGWTGVGAIGCAALAGAVGSVVSDMVEGGKGWKEMAANALMGATIGAVMGPLSSIGGSAIGAGVRGLVSGGLRAGVSAGAKAAGNSARGAVSTEINGLVGNAVRNRASAAATSRSSGSAGRGAADDAFDSCNSFVPGTLVLMADGSKKRIENVRVGDKVYATDPTTGKTSKKAVTAQIIGYGKKNLVRLAIDVNGPTGHKAVELTATDGHPFWVPSLKKWVNATDLAIGSKLRTSAGTVVQVAAVERWTAYHQQARNLTVDGFHTYYVVASNTPVLVHNAGPCKNPLTADQQKDVANWYKGMNKVKGNYGKAAVYEIKKPGAGLPRYYSRDIDQHNGGIFKGANRIEDLWSKDTRSGTYGLDIDESGMVNGLTRTGD